MPVTPAPGSTLPERSAFVFFSDTFSFSSPHPLYSKHLCRNVQVLVLRYPTMVLGRNNTELSKQEQGTRRPSQLLPNAEQIALPRARCELLWNRAVFIAPQGFASAGSLHPPCFAGSSSWTQAAWINIIFLFWTKLTPCIIVTFSLCLSEGIS